MCYSSHRENNWPGSAAGGGDGRRTWTFVAPHLGAIIARGGVSGTTVASPCKMDKTPAVTKEGSGLQ